MNSEIGPNAPGPEGTPNGSVPAKRSPVKMIAIGTGIALGVLFLGGVGAAIAFNLMDRDDSSEVQEGPVEAPGLDETEPPSPDDGETTPEPDPGTDDGEPAGGDADSLIAAIEAAVAHVGGQGATEIEVHRTGWSVEVRQDNRTEVEVFVSLDGTATIRDTDDHDHDDPLIELSQIPDIVRIATEAAGGGTVEEITTDDDDYFYEVEVRLPNGQEVEVELDANLRVLDVDFD